MRANSPRGVWGVLALCSLAGALVASQTAQALINPRFTPVHLAQQSKLILLLKLGPVGVKGDIPVKVAEAIKGKLEGPPLQLSLAETRKEQAESLRVLVKEYKDGPALLYTGDFKEEGGEGGFDGGLDGGFEGGMEGEPQGAGRKPEAMLHIRNKWYSLARDKKGVLHVDALNDDLQATWAGSSAMLVRCTRYVLADPDPAVPPSTGAAWEEHEKIGTVKGRAHGMLAVPVSPGRTWLHVLADGGDQVYSYDKKTRKLKDSTGALKLGAKSRAAAWADLNGDGKLDLASWDGKALSFWCQAADGTFASRPGPKVGASCIGLAVVGVGKAGKPGLLVSTEGIPLLLSPAPAGPFAVKPAVPVAAGKWEGAQFGKPLPCLVADFDNDTIPDMLQPFERAAMFYKGKSPGVFAAGKVIRGVGTGKGRAGAFTGDFEHDGLLDVFVPSEEGCHFWQNQGAGRFEEKLEFTGEASYISQANGIGGNTCDVNNDGRQDIFILYTDIRPHLFFNRGFHSFGHSHNMDLAEKQHLKEQNDAEKAGQQAGIVHDLDGDGAQDMAIVLENGEAWVFWRDCAQGDPLCVRAALPIDAPAGPIRVTAWDQKRCLGAWSIGQGKADVFFGLFQPGPCKVRWQFPGGEVREKTVDVEDGPVDVLLKP